MMGAVARSTSLTGAKACLHPLADHQHGTRARYTLDGCRCGPCGFAKYTYEENRARQIMYGTWEPMVDAAPVRAHVLALRKAGIGRRTLSVRSGVSQSAITKLINGVPSRGREPSKRVRHETADALLEVTADQLAPHALVDGTGTRRRLEALVASGRSVTAVGALLGVSMSNTPTLFAQEWAIVATARKVRALFDEIAFTEPPRETWRERAVITRSQRFAVRRGWLPPGAWLELDMDDPATEPDTESMRRSSSGAGHRIDAP
jgi:hypothetical protein